MSQIVYQIINGNGNNSNDELDDDDEDGDDLSNDLYFDLAEPADNASPLPFSYDQQLDQAVGFSTAFRRKNKSIEIAIELMIKIVI